MASGGQLGSLLSSIPPVTKGLALGILPLGFALQLAVPAVKNYAGLVAGKTLTYAWMIVTSGLLEDNVVSLVVFMAALLYVGRIVEPLHGSREFLRFLLFSLAGTGAATFLAVTAIYYATLSAEQSSGKADHVGAILYTPICGFHGTFAALLVALKQLLSDSEVALFGGLVRCRVKHLPSIYVTLVSLLSLGLGQITEYVPFAMFGTYSAWLYLRFFKPDSSSGLRGDPSDDFRFASFFPPPAQPAVERMSSVASRVTRLGSVPKTGLQHGRGYVLGGGVAASGGGSLGAGDSSDAQRRRERGARALEERLGLKAKEAAAAGGASQAPTAAAGAASAAAPAAQVDIEQPVPPAALEAEAAAPAVEQAAAAEAAPAAQAEEAGPA